MVKKSEDTRESTSAARKREAAEIQPAVPAVPAEITESEGKLLPVSVRLASAKYGRKLNLQLISRNRSFESAEHEILLWTDIPFESQRDPDAVKVCLDYLQNEVKNRVAEKLQETVNSVRAYDQSPKYDFLAIDRALVAVLKHLGVSTEPETMKARSIFEDELKNAQNLLQAQ